MPLRYQEPHWVYRLFDAEGSLLYIGMTINPTARLRHWRSRSSLPRYQWFRSVRRVEWRHYSNHFFASEAERHAIRAEQPPHNYAHRGAVA